MAQKLTTPKRTGLVFTGDYRAISAFMLEAGGYFVNKDQTEVTADSPQNLQALTYVMDNIKKGIFKFAADVDTDWGGEAFGKGTGAFTNCWGIAQQSKTKAAAVALVKHFTTEDEQKSFSKAFGPIPSLESLKDWTVQQAPEKKAFIDGLAYGRTQVAIPGFDSVLNDFNAQL